MNALESPAGKEKFPRLHQSLQSSVNQTALENNVSSVLSTLPPSSAHRRALLSSVCAAPLSYNYAEEKLGVNRNTLKKARLTSSLGSLSSSPLFTQKKNLSLSSPSSPITDCEIQATVTAAKHRAGTNRSGARSEVSSCVSALCLLACSHAFFVPVSLQYLCNCG